MDNNIINDCLSLSLQGKITFPEVVMRLAGTGVEYYIADLAGRKTAYFGVNDEVYSVALNLEKPPKIAKNFDEHAIKNAIADIQQSRISYPVFLERIMSGGCTHYEIFIHGRKAIYFGRNGSFHIENFPPSK